MRKDGQDAGYQGDFAMEHFSLKAFPRELSTKGYLNKSRKDGKIPAVLYGSGKPAENIFVLEAEYSKALKRITASTILELSIDGNKMLAFVKDHQRAAVSKNLLHIDFLEVQEGKKLHARVHLNFLGIPKGVVDGGILENPTHEVEVESDPENLPEKIDVDITSLEANHAFHVRDLPTIENVKILSNPETVLAIVKFAREEEVPVAEVAAPAETATAEATAAQPESSATKEKAE
jgi:large subunit ribosomal protein L25